MTIEEKRTICILDIPLPYNNNHWIKDHLPYNGHPHHTQNIFILIFSTRLSILVGAIAHGQDSVVQVGVGAPLVKVDAGLVEVEGGLTGVNGHGHGADSGHRLLQVLLRAAGDVLEAGDGGPDGGVAEQTLLAVLGGVGVAGLSVNPLVCDHILECMVHQTAHTSEIALRKWNTDIICRTDSFNTYVVLAAVHEVLLAEGHKLSGGVEVGALHRAHGAEGPARAAVLLVLDVGHEALMIRHSMSVISFGLILPWSSSQQSQGGR